VALWLLELGFVAATDACDAGPGVTVTVNVTVGSPVPVAVSVTEPTVVGIVQDAGCAMPLASVVTVVGVGCGGLLALTEFVVAINWTEAFANASWFWSVTFTCGTGGFDVGVSVDPTAAVSAVAFTAPAPDTRNFTSSGFKGVAQAYMTVMLRAAATAAVTNLWVCGLVTSDSNR
jgi:hypothetical protein